MDCFRVIMSLHHGTQDMQGCYNARVLLVLGCIVPRSWHVKWMDFHPIPNPDTKVQSRARGVRMMGKYREQTCSVLLILDPCTRCECRREGQTVMRWLQLLIWSERECTKEMPIISPSLSLSLSLSLFLSLSLSLSLTVNVELQQRQQRERHCGCG